MEDMIMTGPVTELPTTVSQPAPVVPLDDDAVRAAIFSAEKQGLNPETLTVSDLSTVTAPAAPPVETPKIQVPEKFLKPDGEVDVEKLKASTRQLDEAIAKKEEGLVEVQKSIEDFVKDYQEKETRFRNTPNPQRIAEQLPVPPPVQSIPPQQMSDAQLQDLINQDFQRNPAATVANLMEVFLQNKLAPLEQEKKANQVRENIRQIAEKDPRILNQTVYKAIQEELDQNPALWQLKNPHKAAWLEVKERLQLGEFKQTQAQPSKPASPILGGGSPPPTPSVSNGLDPKNPFAILNGVDLHDKKQEAAADAAIRAHFARSDRW